ncbi:catabolite repressor/activator [Vibrio sp. S4M6]|uniref:catabolite repressor/activator n=1 Tax=Vibrio sinus TaxID=2946865 RepID=UPI00202A681C|nr:catabolite repressor/activator [Vibrio sinus]MCL9779848.1 catabolite repressor/activator [Vibrio sinus]
MTLDEIAKLAGVSKTTASYVINGKAKQYRISEKTQQNVMAVVHSNNYRPNYVATSLRGGASHSFGLIVPDLENMSYARLSKHLEQKSRAKGYQILIGCTDDDAEIEKKLVDTLLSRSIDVLFVASSIEDATDFYRRIQDDGTPVIAIDRPLDDEHFSCVISEDFGGAYELTTSLCGDAVTSIGLIGALPKLNISRERENGFKAAANDVGVKPVLGYGQNFYSEDGKKVLQGWIDSGALPDAIMTTSYTLLEGVLDVLVDRPELTEKLKLATFGDNRLLDFLPFKVNSLPQQFDVISTKALELAIAATNKAKNLTPQVELVTRKLKLRQVSKR